MEKSKIKIIIAVIAALITVGIIGGITFSNSPSQQLRRTLDLGEKYLSELNYEQAAVAFKDAFEIDPRNKDVIDGIIRTYSDWSSSLVADQNFESAIAKLDEARALLPDNQELVDKEVDVYLSWIKSYVDIEKYTEALDIAVEGYDKLGDERLKLKLDELSAKIDEIESIEEPIKAKCTLIYIGDMAEAIINEHRFTGNTAYNWEPYGVRFSEPTAFVDDYGRGSTVMLTEATLVQSEYTALFSEVVDGQTILNYEYFDKEIELYFDPWTFISDYYTGDELGFFQYEDDGTPNYKVFPLGGYYVSLDSKSEEILREISKQDVDD